jgi:sigma-54 specific flagellar transcriptional regulator A
MNIAATRQSADDPSPGLVYAPGSPLEGLLRTARRIAASDATVLVTGETGTGKEVIARYVHSRSKRADRPLVPVNCGAIPEALLESELFGHVRGAFTGATGARKGRIALAQGGTLFLDEIGELPLSLQVKLLRVIQERTYEPVGSAESVTADFRLIAATNRDLAAEVEAGRFRRDLYFRLMVVPLEVPALRDRPQDVVVLLHHFWKRRGETRAIDPAVLARLQAYSWPGNVRELENLVERLSVCVEGPTVRLEDLPPRYRDDAGPARFDGPAVVRGRAANADRPVEPAPFPDGGIASLLPPIALPPEGSAAAPMPAIPIPEGWATPAIPAVPAPDAPALPAAPSVPPELRSAPAPEPIAGALPPLRRPEPRPPAGEPEAAAVGFPRPLSLPAPGQPLDLPGLLRRLEDLYIDCALARTNGNRKAAAESLGLQRTTLVEKLRRRARLAVES